MEVESTLMIFNNNILKRIVAGLLAGLIGVTISLLPSAVSLEQSLGLHWLFHLRDRIAPPADVILVAIGQPTADQLGLPFKPSQWPRNLHARIIDNLSRAGASAIIFDIRFDSASSTPEHDIALAEAMHKADNVVIVEKLDARKTGTTDGLPAQDTLYLSKEKSAVPIPLIAGAAKAHVPFLLPLGTRVDQYWTFKTSAGGTPTLPAAALQVFGMPLYPDLIHLLEQNHSFQENTPPDLKHHGNIEDTILTLRDLFTSDPTMAQQVLQQLEADQNTPARQKQLLTSLVRLYSDDDMHYLNLYGPPHTIRVIPYEAILGLYDPGSAIPVPDPDQIKGKAVFIGFSGSTQPEQDVTRDDYNTVFSRSDGLYISGVEIAATAFANLLEGRSVQPLPVSTGMAVIFLWGFAITVLCLVIPHQIAAVSALSTAALLYILYSRYQFGEQGLWMPLVVPLCLQAPLAVLSALLLRYRQSRKESEVLKTAFGKFIPEKVVNEIICSTKVSSNSQLVYGICLATDADQYTALAENMDPRQLGSLMNEYYATLFEPVSRHGGIISDVIGDAMLAIWTTSTTDPATLSALRTQACLACLDISAALERFNLDARRPKLPTRMGLHAGEMLLGNIGAAQHFEFRAVGDMVNTASRIQGLNKYLGTSILLSGEIAKNPDNLILRPLGRFLLAGKSSPTDITELLSVADLASEEKFWLCKRFAKALHAYSIRDWQAAFQDFSAISSTFSGDGPARFYLERCQHYLVTPPDSSWDPVIRMQGK